MERNDKENNKHISIIHENDMIQNLKKYYNINDHIDLLKFIKKNITNTNHYPVIRYSASKIKQILIY